MRRGAALLLAGLAASAASGQEGFAPGVDAAGAISVPAVDYRTEWAFLGVFAVRDADEVAQFHMVYTQPETVSAYRETGRYPDGAVLLKELWSGANEALATGEAAYPGEPAGWFVMVRDRENRFPGDPLWGDGWGWALFEPGAPDRTVTTDYRAECLACHEPARETDLSYVRGYPALAGPGR